MCSSFTWAEGANVFPPGWATQALPHGLTWIGRLAPQIDGICQAFPVDAAFFGPLTTMW
jgi:hypothetical protein